MQVKSIDEVMLGYEQLETYYDASARAMWFSMAPRPRPCCTWELVKDILRFQQSMRAFLDSRDPHQPPPIHYLIFGSNVPGVFSLGGDLALFRSIILAKNRDSLAQYAEQCVTILYNHMTGLGKKLMTISLLQGDALGAGFESALSSSVVIAERGIRAGFPEIIFNLIPGHVAYHLLARRKDPAHAEKIILGGRLY